MTRYFLNKIGDVVDEIVTQDKTGVYSTAKEGSKFKIYLWERARIVPIFIGKKRQTKKKILNTTKEYFKYHRVYNQGIYRESLSGLIIEDKRTKEEIVASFNK